MSLQHRTASGGWRHTGEADPLPVANATAPTITEIDEGATYTYVGKAAPGTATSAAGWQIVRLENATGSTRLAEGNNQFAHVWDNRAGLSYS